MIKYIKRKILRLCSKMGNCPICGGKGTVVSAANVDICTSCGNSAHYF